jgi:hypothetical protein
MRTLHYVSRFGLLAVGMIAIVFSSQSPDAKVRSSSRRDPMTLRGTGFLASRVLTRKGLRVRSTRNQPAAFPVTLLRGGRPRPFGSHFDVARGGAACVRKGEAIPDGTTSLRASAASANDPYEGLRQRGEDGTSQHGYTVALIVPTGIGASIGGYAGDALPVARVLSTVADTLVTHPNVVNGAMLYWPMHNMLYTEVPFIYVAHYASRNCNCEAFPDSPPLQINETLPQGYALDQFANGKLGLLPVDTGGHKIGLLLDGGIDEELRIRHLQAADAARATLGINVHAYTVTEESAYAHSYMRGQT